jgi:hypothetical protein
VLDLVCAFRCLVRSKEIVNSRSCVTFRIKLGFCCKELVAPHPTPSWMTSSVRFCFPPARRWYLAWLILRHSKWRRHFPPKRRLIFNRQHDFIFQKLELFTATPAGTSNSTYLDFLFELRTRPRTSARGNFSKLEGTCYNIWLKRAKVTRTKRCLL